MYGKQQYRRVVRVHTRYYINKLKLNVGGKKKKRKKFDSVEGNNYYNNDSKPRSYRSGLCFYHRESVCSSGLTTTRRKKYTHTQQYGESCYLEVIESRA